MSTPSRLTKLSSFLALLMAVFIVGFVLTFLTFLLLPDLAREILITNAPVSVAFEVPSTGTIYALLAAGAVLVGVQIFVLWNMRKLFQLYACAEMLSENCAHHIGQIGIGLIVFPFVSASYGAWASYMLTRFNIDGQGQVVVGLSSHSIGYLIGGLMLLLVATAMREAARVAAENRAFV